MSKGKLIGGLLVLLLIGGLGWIKFKNNKAEALKNMPQGKGGPPMIGATGFVTEYSRLSNTLNTNGTILAQDEVQLQPEVPGRVVYINIKEGGIVAKGTLLVKLNDDDLQAQVKKLQAQLAIAKSNESRLAELLAIKGVSQQEYDVTLNTINNILADIELLQAQIAKTEIRAPFSGKLGLRNISLGANISTNTVVTSLQSNSQLKIDISVPEKYAPAIHTGDVMQFKVAGISTAFSARVSAVESMIDESTRNLKIRAIIQGNTTGLLPGAFAKVQLQLKEIPDAIMVPSNAVIPEAKMKKMIVADSGKAKFVVVETGIRTDNEVQITSGLNVGDTVVTSGLLQIKPGTMIQFSKVTSKSTIQ